MIVVLDDEKLICEILASTLEELGHEARTTQDSKKGFQMALRPEVKLLITDISMPNHNGIEIIKALKKKRPELKILCMSGLIEVLQEELEEQGVNYFLEKPFNIKDFIKTVESILEGQQCMEAI